MVVFDVFNDPPVTGGNGGRAPSPLHPYLENILIDDSMYICPKHRSSYGIDWYVPERKCCHPDHDPKHPPSKTDLRCANLTLCSKIEGFPVGGK
jgi:hypothetical protein